MNWAKKFYDMNLSEIEDVIVGDAPFFINGIEVKETKTDYRILVYQEPFSDVVVSVVYKGEKEVDSERYLFDPNNNVWSVLPGKRRDDDSLIIL